jgi:hypothetical protein
MNGGWPVLPCPEEDQDPLGVPAGRLTAPERLIRCIAGRDMLSLNDEGIAVLQPTAIKKSDLEGKDGRSVSTLREDHTPSDEVLRRASYFAQQEEWSGDPVIAFASASDFWSILDKEGRRDICAFADRTNEDDPLGPCDTHASIKRSCSPPQPYQRSQMAKLRSEVAEKFTEIRHFSGPPPSL